MEETDAKRQIKAVPGASFRRVVLGCQIGQQETYKK